MPAVVVSPAVGVRSRWSRSPGLTCRVEVPVLLVSFVSVPVTMWSPDTVAVQVWSPLLQVPSSGLIERVVDPVR